MAGLRSSVHTNPAMSNRCANGLLPADRGACPNSERIPRLLVTLHAIATLAAAFALVFAPTAIPGTVGIVITSSAYLSCYLRSGRALHWRRLVGCQVSDGPEGVPTCRDQLHCLPWLSGAPRTLGVHNQSKNYDSAHGVIRGQFLS